MSKNCELFVNLCNFMKYLLNEILPYQDPTDSVKYAAQDILSAILLYAKKIDYELSPVLNNVDADSGVFDAREVPLKCSKPSTSDNNVKRYDQLQVTHLPIISIKSEPQNMCQNLSSGDVSTNVSLKANEEGVSYKHDVNECLIQRSDKSMHNLCGELDKCCIDELNATFIISHNDLDANSTSCISPDNNIRKNTVKNSYNSKKSNENEKLKNIQNKLKNDNKLKKTYPSKAPAGSFLASSYTPDHVSEKFFEENFLQFYFFSDLKFICDNPRASTSHSMNDKSDKSRQSLDSQPSVEKVLTIYRVQDVIPYEFRDLNKCFLSKLVKEAYYCWKCNEDFDTYKTLEQHLNGYHKHGSTVKGELLTIFDICEDCSFSVIVPNSVVNQIMEFHHQSHETVPSWVHQNSYGKEKSARAKDEAELFVNIILQKKIQLERVSRTYSFLGICLICKAYFWAPLEWKVHLFDFDHLRLPNEEYVTCAPCCLIILGTKNQSIEKYLHAYMHSYQCPLALGQQNFGKHWDNGS